MALDRKDYKTAIPQLEKRIKSVEQKSDNGLVQFDILQQALEAERLARQKAILKVDESVDLVTVKMYYVVKPTGVTPTSDDVGWAETMPTLDSTNDDKVLWYKSRTLRNGVVVNETAPQQIQLMNGVFSFINTVSGDNGWTTIDGDTISTGTITANVGDSFFDLDNGTFQIWSNVTQQGLIWNGSTLRILGDVEITALDNLEVGGRNLLRGTATMANGNSGWNAGHWRASGTGGTISYGQTITNPPITGIKGITIQPTTANAQIGFVQDYAPIAKREITQSVWVKGKAGDKIDLQPIWANAVDEEEYGSKRYELEDTNWHKLTYTKTPNHDHASVSLGYVYLYAVDTSHTVQFIAPQLEYGNKASDWSPAKEDVDAEVLDASKTATNYLTTISGTTGISVHDANDTDNFVNMNSNGVGVYKNGDCVAQFADSVRIGKSDGARTEIHDYGIDIIDSYETTALKIETTGTKQTILHTDRGNWIWVDDGGLVTSEINFTGRDVALAVAGTAITVSFYFEGVGNINYTRSFTAQTDSYFDIGGYRVTYQYSSTYHRATFRLTGTDVGQYYASIRAIQYYVNDKVPQNFLYGITYIDGNVRLNDVDIISPTLDSSLLSPISSRCTIQSGGVLKLGKWVFVQLCLKVASSLSASSWGLVSGLPVPSTSSVTALSASIQKNTGGNISANVTSAGNIAVQLPSTASADEVILINGWYISA